MFTPATLNRRLRIFCGSVGEHVAVVDHPVDPHKDEGESGVGVPVRSGKHAQWDGHPGILAGGGDQSPVGGLVVVVDDGEDAVVLVARRLVVGVLGLKEPVELGGLVPNFISYKVQVKSV